MSKKESKKLNEIKIYGINACMAVFKNRPNAIIQLFLTKKNLNQFSSVTKYLAQNKKAYHLVSTKEIDQMTNATHHEDVCMLVQKKLSRTIDQYLKAENKQSILIVLENVSNPHNIGAIIRSCAHFGVNGIVLSDKKIFDTNAAIRTAEGGHEFIEVFEEKKINTCLTKLQKNKYQIITTSSHATNSLYDLKWKDKVAIVFGEEGEGISKETLALGETIKIPGTDNVESLNVSVASAVILSDYFQKVKMK